MRPSGLLLGALWGNLALSAMQLVLPGTRPWWWLPGAALGLLSLADALVLLARPLPRLRRWAPASSLAGLAFTLELEVEIPTRWGPARSVRIVDGLPAEFTVPAQPLVIQPGSGTSTHRLSYQAVAPTRGTWALVPAWVEQDSALGLWLKRGRSGEAGTLRVYPPVPSAGRGLGSWIHSQKGTMHPSRLRGTGLEFHQLREYRQGDLLRLVDPRASSRLGKLVVKEMHEEEDQHILVLLDTGYRMMAGDEGVPHFDHAFAGVLSLCQAALAQGDRVTVQCFGASSQRIGPCHGSTSLATLVAGLHHVQAGPVSSSPASALLQALPRLKRRSLIMLVSNFREEDEEDLDRFIPALRSRHLVCTLWLREHVADELATMPTATRDQAWQSTMAQAYLEDRRRCLVRWEEAGIITIDTNPTDLTASLVGTYLDIKAQGRL